MIFHNDKLWIEEIPQANIPTSVQEMLIKARNECDYQTLKRYYGATIFFMKHELELYRSYVLALGIILYVFFYVQ